MSKSQAATMRNSLQVNRSKSSYQTNTPSSQQASKELQIVPILFPEPKPISKAQLQVKPKGNSKTKPMTTSKKSILNTSKQTSNHLRASQPTAKPESRTLTFGNTTLVLPRDQHKLAALKQEALDYWNNLPEIT